MLKFQTDFKLHFMPNLKTNFGLKLKLILAVV